MKNFNIKKSLRFLAVGGSMTVLATLMFNCGGKQFKSAESDGSSTGGFTPLSFDKPVSPYAQMTAEQQFNSMLNVTGQDMPTTAMKTEYNLRQGALADNDNLAGVTAPLLMASTSLAGEVCNGLITKEAAMAAASRSFFNDVDFTKTVAANAANSFSNTAERMSQAFYSRALSADEQAQLTAFYTEFVSQLAGQATQAAGTRALHLALCTALLSSYDSMTF